MDNAEPEQEALFHIEGPDEDGCVWACSAEGRDGWCQNLGPKEKVLEEFTQWPSSAEAASVALSLTPEELSRLDGWIAEQEGEKPSRREAVRRLLNLLLA
jgi:hypothetical protein